MTAYGSDANARQKFWREQAEAEVLRRGFKERWELQMLWRSPECFTRKYDSGEVIAAICSALTQEGQTAWPGDGTSIVEQMIRLQVERAQKAERIVDYVCGAIAMGNQAELTVEALPK